MEDPPYPVIEEEPHDYTGDLGFRFLENPKRVLVAFSWAFLFLFSVLGGVFQQFLERLATKHSVDVPGVFFACVGLGAIASVFVVGSLASASLLWVTPGRRASRIAIGVALGCLLFSFVVLCAFGAQSLQEIRECSWTLATEVPGFKSLD